MKNGKIKWALLTLPKDYSLVFTYVITILNWTFDENKIDSALAILLNYKNENCIIFHPKNLKDTWVNETNKIDFFKKHQNTILLQHEKILKEDLTNKILICWWSTSYSKNIKTSKSKKRFCAIYWLLFTRWWFS